MRIVKNNFMIIKLKINSIPKNFKYFFTFGNRNF